MLMVFSNVLCEATYTYYIAARSQFTVKKSLQKLFSFPVLYAMIAGILYNMSGLDFPDLFTTYWAYAKGAYVILGMMIIGVALAASEKFEVAPRFLGLVFLGKFVLWPALVLAYIFADTHFFGIFPREIHTLMFVLSIVPTAANIAAFSAQFNVRPGKAAATILIGTIFALFYIPAMLVIFGLY
jgi:malate permease and related proteins